MKSDRKNNFLPPLVSSGVPSDVALIAVFFWGTLLHQSKINECVFFVLLLLLPVKSLLCGSASWSSCHHERLPCHMPHS